MPTTTRTLRATPTTFRHKTLVVPADELRRLRDRYPNVLIVGSDAAAEIAVDQLRPAMRLPITSVRVDRADTLPLTLSQGTLILRNVAALSLTEQRRLHEWLSWTFRATQVVSTSPVSLLPLLKRGTFLDALYYRLNTAYFELGDQ